MLESTNRHRTAALKGDPMDDEKSLKAVLTAYRSAFASKGDAVSARARKHASRILGDDLASPRAHSKSSSWSWLRSSRTVAMASKKSTPILAMVYSAKSAVTSVTAFLGVIWFRCIEKANRIAPFHDMANERLF